MRVGIIGGGQLGMYLVDAAHKLGYTTVALDPAKEGPAKLNSDVYLCAQYDDLEALKEMCKQVDVVTYEFENVEAGVIDYIGETLHACVPQGKNPLLISQHRTREKSSMNNVGIKTAKYKAVNDKEDAIQIQKELNYPYIIKTCTGGYDGKGQWLIQNEKDFKSFIEEMKSIDYIAEELVDFACEVSVIAVRSKQGQVITYEPIENIHKQGILHLSISPARVSEEIKAKAKQVAIQMMDQLHFVGIVTIEMFVGKDGEIYVNEIAPRPHNSGHLTMDGYQVSQYENALRAICSGDILNPIITKPCVMVNVLGQHMGAVKRNQIPDCAKLYLYGKTESRMNRKMGHITFWGEDIDRLITLAQASII